MLATAPAFLVRWMQPSDVPGLVELFAECYPDERWRARDFHRFTRDRRRDNRIKVLVDENDEDQRILAAIALTVTEDDCRIRRLAVPAELRRQGYATQILTHVAGRQSAIQRRIFSAAVPEDNLDAQLFFRDSAAGFRFDPADRRRYADGRQGYVFKFLKAPRRRRATAHV